MIIAIIILSLILIIDVVFVYSCLRMASIGDREEEEEMKDVHMP